MSSTLGAHVMPNKRSSKSSPATSDHLHGSRVKVENRPPATRIKYRREEAEEEAEEAEEEGAKIVKDALENRRLKSRDRDTHRIESELRKSIGGQLTEMQFIVSIIIIIIGTLIPFSLCDERPQGE